MSKVSFTQRLLLILILLAIFMVFRGFISDRTQHGGQYGSGKEVHSVQVDSGSHHRGRTFRTQRQLEDHYRRHGGELGYRSMDDYVSGANAVISRPGNMSSLQNDGDTQYLNPDTCEYVVVSRDQYIRTYFRPNRDCVRYFERQK